MFATEVKGKIVHRFSVAGMLATAGTLVCFVILIASSSQGIRRLSIGTAEKEDNVELILDIGEGDSSILRIKLREDLSGKTSTEYVKYLSRNQQVLLFHNMKSHFFILKLFASWHIDNKGRTISILSRRA